MTKWRNWWQTGRSWVSSSSCCSFCRIPGSSPQLWRHGWSHHWKRTWIPHLEGQRVAIFFTFFWVSRLHSPENLNPGEQAEDIRSASLCRYMRRHRSMHPSPHVPKFPESKRGNTRNQVMLWSSYSHLIVIKIYTNLSDPTRQNVRKTAVKASCSPQVLLFESSKSSQPAKA